MRNRECLKHKSILSFLKKHPLKDIKNTHWRSSAHICRINSGAIIVPVKNHQHHFRSYTSSKQTVSQTRQCIINTISLGKLSIFLLTLKTWFLPALRTTRPSPQSNIAPPLSDRCHHEKLYFLTSVTLGRFLSFVTVIAALSWCGGTVL